MKSPEEITRQELDQVVLDWRAARAERLELQKMVDKVEELETQLKTLIIDAMNAQKFEGVIVGGRSTSVTEKHIPICEDRAAFEAYIFEHHALDLLQFRVATKAVELRQADGIVVPGIGSMVKYDISDKKA